MITFFYFNLGLHHQGIFRVSGSQVEISNFREGFERGEDPLADTNDASDINSVAGVLKLYLRELREPLFPIIYFDHFVTLARKTHDYFLFSPNSPKLLFHLYYYFRIGLKTGTSNGHSKILTKSATASCYCNAIFVRFPQPVSSLQIYVIPE